MSTPDEQSGQPAGVSDAPFPNLTVADDAMTAELVFPPHYRQRLLPTLEWLKTQGVVYGIDRKALAKSVAEATRSAKPLACRIASGKPPQAAQDGFVEHLFKKTGADNAIGDKRVDFHETGTIIPALKDQPLARIHPPAPGAGGINVRGEEVPPDRPQGVEARFKVGPNVRQEGDQLLAECAGMVKAQGITLQVLPELHINGDVDYRVGNVRFPGPIVINGSVTSGFVVEAAGDVSITGDIEDAQVTVGGNLKLQRGCVGKGDTLVKVQGGMQAAFIENSRIEANGDITVKSHILHSEVQSDGMLKVDAGKGVISGGRVSAVKGIHARILGSPSVVKTMAAIVDSRRDAEAMANLQKQLTDAETNLHRIALAVGEGKMKVLLEHGDAITDAKFGRQTPILKKLAEECRKLTARISELESDIAEKKEASAALEKGVIQVQARIFQGVTLQIGPSSREVQEDLAGTTFKYDPEKGLISM